MTRKTVTGLPPPSATPSVKMVPDVANGRSMLARYLSVFCVSYELVRPFKANPAYKGKWYAPMVDNPAYKGEWAPRKIANPDFFEDLAPVKSLKPIVSATCSA